MAKTTGSARPNSEPALLCSINNCDRSVFVKKRLLCKKHYNEWRDAQDRGPCSSTDCDQRAWTAGMCRPCYTSNWMATHEFATCKVQTCDLDATAARGFCPKHHRKDLLYEDPEADMRQVAKTVCEIDDENCSRPGGQITRGLCRKHYKKLMQYEDPHAGVFMDPYGTWLQFVLDAVKSETDECIVKPKGASSHKYWTVRYEGERWYAHILALTLAKGPRPEGLDACHKPVVCHNTRCVNPRHLRWDTRAANLADKVKDGTHNRGVAHPLHKLAVEQVWDIRESKDPAKSVAARHECSTSMVYGIRAGTHRPFDLDRDGTTYHPSKRN